MTAAVTMTTPNHPTSATGVPVAPPVLHIPLVHLTAARYYGYRVTHNGIYVAQYDKMYTPVEVDPVTMHLICVPTQNGGPRRIP